MLNSSFPQKDFRLIFFFCHLRNLRLTGAFDQPYVNQPALLWLPADIHETDFRLGIHFELEATS